MFGAEVYEAVTYSSRVGRHEATALSTLLDRIEDCSSRAEALDMLKRENLKSLFDFSDGEVLPPVIENGYVTFRVRKHYPGKIYISYDGKAKLP